MTTRFAFDFDRAYRIAGLPFGVRPATTEVLVSADVLSVRFGPWRLRTPLANITDVALDGPYRLHRTAGPAHLSLGDRGITFATNGRRGVCLQLAEPVPGIDPFGRIHHPNVTVTVDDPDRLVALLAG